MMPSILAAALASIALGTVPPPAGADPAEPTLAARARANLPSLFSSDDYPVEAMRKEDQGTVAVRLDIGRGGAVSACSVTQTSGSAVLDLATCSILKERARFTPARDAAGQPTEDSTHTRIRWLLPEREPERVVDRLFRTIYPIDADRQISQCLRQTGEGPSKIYPCGPEQGYFQTVIDGAPEAFGVAGRQLVFEVAQFLGDAGAQAKLGERPGEKIIGRNQLRLAIDDQGTVVGCELEESVGQQSESRGDAMCARERNQKFEALDPGVPNRGVRYLTKIGALYFRPK